MHNTIAIALTYGLAVPLGAGPRTDARPHPAPDPPPTWGELEPSPTFTMTGAFSTVCRTFQLVFLICTSFFRSACGWAVAAGAEFVGTRARRTTGSRRRGSLALPYAGRSFTAFPAGVDLPVEHELAGPRLAQVAFSPSTYASLQRIAARGDRGTGLALRQAITLTDYLEMAIDRGARVTIDHDGRQSELVLR